MTGPLNSLPLRSDWEQSLIRAHWPEGAPYGYRKGTGYADQYEELLAIAKAGGDAVRPVKAVSSGEGFRWACVYCRSNGAADNARHAVVLTNNHQAYACPATATVYDDQPPPSVDKNGRLHFSAGKGDGYVQRVARHQLMHELYPDLVPAWTESFRGRKE